MFNSNLIRKFQSLETPFYYYDIELLKQTLCSAKKIADKHGYKIHYALKANSNDRILQIIKDHGFGADCVSGNEVAKALQIGFAPEDIVFAGVGKTDKEILLALANRIHCFNCESMPEMEVLDQLAGGMSATASIALRINPDLDAKTHHYITTGLEENKFGIYFEDLEETLALLTRLKRLNLIGLHFHIGSQVTDLQVFKGLCLRVNKLQNWLKERHISIEHVNVGGGFGIDYHHPDDQAVPDLENYFQVFQQFLEPLPNQTVHFELGRALVGQCGSLISRVLYVKHGVHTNFVILDAGMTELIRPALYQSFHKIENLSSTRTVWKYDVVGPICESSDCFGKAVTLPKTERGDLMALRSTGAYAEVMASQYNLRDLAPAVYSDEL